QHRLHDHPAPVEPPRGRHERADIGERPTAHFVVTRRWHRWRRYPMAWWTPCARSVGAVSSTRSGGVRLFFQRWVNRLRVGRAAVLWPLAGLAQRFVPMTRWATVLGRPGAVPDAWSGRRIEALPSRAASVAERDVAVTIRRAARRLPWK